MCCSSRPLWTGSCVQRLDGFGQEKRDFNLTLLRFFGLVAEERENGHRRPSDLNHLGMANLECATAGCGDPKGAKWFGPHITGNTSKGNHRRVLIESEVL